MLPDTGRLTIDDTECIGALLIDRFVYKNKNSGTSTCEKRLLSF